MDNFPLFIDPGHRAVKELAHLAHGIKGESPQLFHLYAKGCDQMAGLLKCIDLSYIYATKEVNRSTIERIQDVPDLIGLLTLLLRPSQMLLPVLFRSFLEEELNSHSLIVHGIQVALVAMAFHVHHMITDTEDLQNRLPILLEGIPKAGLDMIGLGKTPARHKARIGRGRLTALGEPLKVVGIVNGAARNGLARDPGEGLVAARAEHLVASVYFTDHFAAGRARLRILPNESGRCEGLGGTGMGYIPVQALDLKALGAGPGMAQTALPGAGQEPITLGHGASPNELGGGGPHSGT